MEKNTITSISSPAKATDIIVYPNPSEGLVTVEAKGAPISAIQLFNAQGKLLHSRDGLNQNSLILSIEDRASGLYILHVVDHNGLVSAHRMIKGQ